MKEAESAGAEEGEREVPAGSGWLTVPAFEEPLVSILIPTTSQADLLWRCLDCLVKNIGAGVSYEVVVVLNAATDAVRELVNDRIRGVLVLDAPVNLGVAGGYNRARNNARGKYLVLLHDDTEIEPNWLEALVEAADANPEAGAVASMVLYPGGELQSAGCVIWREGWTATPWQGGEAQAEHFLEQKAVDYSGTSSLLVRADTWDDIGGLDERLYPAYYVDVDLCMAIRDHGQIVLYTPHSRVYHHRGASNKKRFRQFMALRNRAIFMAKWTEQLHGYQPMPIGVGGGDAESLRRAHEHTRATAAAISARWRPRQKSAARTLMLDPDRQNESHRRLERDLKDAYLVQLEEEIVHLSDEMSEKLAHLAESQARLSEVKEQVKDLKELLKETKVTLKETRKRLAEVEKGIWQRWRRRILRWTRAGKSQS